MKIHLSEIQIIPVRPKNGLVAFLTFVLDNSFYIGNVAIYTRLGKNGYRLVYPARTLPNGKKIQSFHPINCESAQAIEEQVFEAFSKLTEKATIMNENGR